MAHQCVTCGRELSDIEAKFGFERCYQCEAGIGTGSADERTEPRAGTSPQTIENVQASLELQNAVPVQPTSKNRDGSFHIRFGEFLGKVVAGLIGLIVLIVALGFVIQAFGGGDDGDQDDEMAVVAATQPAPTPGALEAEPTFTQEPRTEEPTLVSLLLDDCSGFLGDMQSDLEQSAHSLTAISDLSFDAASDPVLLLDPGWQADVRAEYDRLQLARNHAAALDAPTAGLEDIQAKALEGLDQLLASEAPLFRGVDSLDPAEINEAVRLVEAATEAFVDATAMITAFDVSECLE